MTFPDAATLVAQVRKVMSEGTAEDAGRLLDQYAPEIDELADVSAAADWLGISASSIYRERSRQRADGSAAWPAPDAKFGRSGAWRYRTLVLHRAGMPGRGSAGRGRPRRVMGGDDV